MQSYMLMEYIAGCAFQGSAGSFVAAQLGSALEKCLAGISAVQQSKTLTTVNTCYKNLHDLECGGAVPQQRPAMSEEAVAAIDADMEGDKGSGSKAQKRKVTDSGKMETNGYHHMHGKANGEKTVDAFQVAEKVWVCLVFCEP
jgi:hypothetical protein